MPVKKSPYHNYNLKRVYYRQQTTFPRKVIPTKTRLIPIGYFDKVYRILWLDEKREILLPKSDLLNYGYRKIKGLAILPIKRL